MLRYHEVLGTVQTQPCVSGIGLVKLQAMLTEEETLKMLAVTGLRSTQASYEVGATGLHLALMAPALLAGLLVQHRTPNELLDTFRCFGITKLEVTDLLQQEVVLYNSTQVNEPMDV